MLLLIGHGSIRHPGAGRILHRHAETLRCQGHDVEVAFLNGSPSIPEALHAVSSLPIRVVPFFMEDGWFTRAAIPRALDGVNAHLCPPIGTHPALANLIHRQADAACHHLAIPPHESAILLIGHGSASAPGRHLALYDHAATLAARRHFAAVAPACLEEPPFVADTLATLRARPVIVIGYFANLGGHVTQDVPCLLDAERAARGPGAPPVHFAGCVTEDPAIPGIILDQARRGPSQGG
jgi:sirohydrochlorin cobaltochelatase